MADLGAIGKYPVAIWQPLFGGEVSGTVKDSTGAFASRLVRAHHRKSGEHNGGAISDKTTGAYTIFTNFTRRTDQVYVVELDDDAGDQYNARIFDRVTPF